MADLFAHSHSPEWVPRSYQHGALRLRVSLGWILVLQGGLDDQLLLVISPAGPVLISLHSPPRTVVRKPATGTAESPLLLEARAHTPLARGRKGSRFPRHEGSALLAGCAEPEGWEGMAEKASLQGCYYSSENGRLLLAGQRKTNPKQNNTQCAASVMKDQPHCVCLLHVEWAKPM